MKNMHLSDIEKPDQPQAPTLGWKSDLAAEMLRKLDIPFVALNPGASYRGFHDSLVNYLGNADPKMILCLHEDHVVALAHGFAKATDRPMGAILHSNVGLMHGLMGIFNAYCDRAPMMVVGATGPIAPEKRRPWIDWIHTSKDQGAMLRNFVKWDDEPRSSEGIVESFLRGYQLSTSAPMAPVYICLDAGLQEEALSGQVMIPDVKRFKAPSPPAAGSADLESLVELIVKSKKPVFMFGRGSRRQSHWDTRVKLAELAGASVFTSQRERAVFPTQHGLQVFPPMSTVSAEARDFLLDADLIVSFDYPDLQGFLKQVRRQTSELAASLTHISVDQILHNGWSMDHFGLPPTDLRIMADPDVVVVQLQEALSRRLDGKPRWDGNSRRRWTEMSYSHDAETQMSAADIEVALAELRGERKLTLSHLSFGWAGRAYHWNDPLDYLGHDGGAGLAAGPGLTIGAALALKDTDRTVVCVTGDGDFIQGATALWTAAHYSIPALFIVSNNRSQYNDEIHQEAVAKVRDRPVENKWIGMRIDEPAMDIAGLARAQGVEALGPVKSLAEFRIALQKAFAAVDSGRPFLIDAVVKPGYFNKLVTRGD